MALVLSGSIDISGSMTATTIIVSAPGAPGMVSSSNQLVELNTATGSLIGITNGLTSFTASLNSKTGSYAITGSNTFYGNQTITGSVSMTGSLRVGDWVGGSPHVDETARFDVRTTVDRGIKITGNVSSDVIITAYRGASDDLVRGMVLQGNAVNFYIGDGNANTGSYVAQFNTNGLAFAAGKGIDFSATSNGSGTTSSELLNDYEEGTWTPTITFGGGATSLTYNTQYGVYTKIGNVVHFSFRLILTNKGSSTGAAAIGGLPFTSANTNGNFGAVPVAFADAVVSFDKTLTWIVDPNATTINLRYCNGTNYADMNDTFFTNTSNIIASGTYRTA